MKCPYRNTSDSSESCASRFCFINDVLNIISMLFPQLSLEHLSNFYQVYITDDEVAMDFKT